MKGGIFIVDNCAISMVGNNVGTQDALFNLYDIFMITLPPYHPEYNLTELVFNTLLYILSCERARYNSLYVNDFLDVIKKK